MNTSVVQHTNSGLAGICHNHQMSTMIGHVWHPSLIPAEVIALGVVVLGGSTGACGVLDASAHVLCLCTNALLVQEMIWHILISNRV